MRGFGSLLPTGLGSREQSRALAERLARAESRNITDLREVPTFWTRALGANVEDADGNVFLDFGGAFGVSLAGHGHPAIREAVHRQTDLLLHGMGDIHPPQVKVELLEALADLSPWADARGILGTSGSDAVESALKTVHLATGNPGILAFEGSYHGLALGALATTHRDHFRTPFVDRLTEHVRFIPFPGDAARSLSLAEDVLSAGAAGAVIVEPIQGRGGVRIPPAGFLRELVGLAHDHGALVVFDEVFTGLGRTGRLFAGDWDDVQPDVLCLGKALGGGMPISACLASADTMNAWPASSGEAVHTSTFLGHPVACASALAFLQVLVEEKLAVRADQLGRRMLTRLEGAFGREDRSPPSDVRGRGLMIGIETAAPEGGVRAAQVALTRGLITLPAGPEGRVLELTPPALLTDDQVDRGLEIVVDAIAAAG